ncbi:MAG: hypothetical protein IKO10_02330 [Lachnospiraceae bacterium]|nr:hypothetical protein [Lachnospiraceae bacterium]
MNAAEFLLWITPIGTPVFVILSIVLYMKKRIEAKETGQQIKKIYERLFTISVAIIVLCVGGIGGAIIICDNAPYMQKSRSSSDNQLADSVHTAVLTAMMDPEIMKKEEYTEDLAELANEIDITKYTGEENCILAGALKVLWVEDFQELGEMIRSRGATGRILVTAYGPNKVRVVIEGTEHWMTGEEITIQ